MCMRSSKHSVKWPIHQVIHIPFLFNPPRCRAVYVPACASHECEAFLARLPFWPPSYQCAPGRA
eukprot:6409657-Prymnesium_polylepis.1